MTRRTPRQKQWATINQPDPALANAGQGSRAAHVARIQAAGLRHLLRTVTGHGRAAYEGLTGGAEYRTIAAAIRAAIEKLGRVE